MEQVPVDGPEVEVEAVVPLVSFVVLSFLHLLVEEAEVVEVPTGEVEVEDSLLILGSHTMEELFRPLVVALVVTAPPMVEEVVAVVVDQVDLLVADTPDLINGMVVVEEEEETPTIDLI